MSSSLPSFPISASTCFAVRRIPPRNLIMNSPRTVSLYFLFTKPHPIRQDRACSVTLLLLSHILTFPLRILSSPPCPNQLCVCTTHTHSFSSKYGQSSVTRLLSRRLPTLPPKFSKSLTSSCCHYFVFFLVLTKPRPQCRSLTRLGQRPSRADLNVFVLGLLERTAERCTLRIVTRKVELQGKHRRMTKILGRTLKKANQSQK